MVPILVLGLFLGGTALRACNPEPGPNHFPPPPQLDIPVGYFELHSTLTGLPCNSIRSLLALEGLVFAGTEGEGLLVFADGAWRQFTPSSDPPFPAPTVSSFLQESDDVILAGTPGGIVRITQFTGDKGIRFQLLPTKGPLGPDVLSLAKTPAGKDVLAGTFYGAGTRSGEEIVPFKTFESIQPTGFEAIENVGQTSWFGCSDGLLELQGSALRLKDLPPHDFGWVHALETDGSSLFIGGSKGLFELKEGKCREILPGIWTSALCLTPGTRDVFQGMALRGLELASMTQGVKDTQAFLDAQRVLREMNARYQRIMDAWNQGTLLTEAYFAYLQDLAAINERVQTALMKGLWVGTQDSGVILFTTDGDRRHLSKDNSKLPSNRVTAISGLESGETWIGTFDGGILRYRSYRFRVASEPDPVFSGDAQTIETIGENLYVGTRQDGLYVFHQKTLSQLNHLSPSTREGFHASVESVAADKDGNLWIAGDSALWQFGSTSSKRFGPKEGIPWKETVQVTVDQDGRIYVAGQASPQSISHHLAAFTGEGFTHYSVDTLRKILNLSQGERDNALRTMGLLDTFPQSFDASKASEALRLYDPGSSVTRVSALLGTSRYLLIGTEDSLQYVFDGAGFKPLNVEGPGNVGQVLAYGRRSNGTTVTLGPNRLVTFDGQVFAPVFDVASPSVSRYTDLCMDNMNPDLFWASFESGGGGGFGLYQHPKWDAIWYKEPIRAIRHAFPYVFVITPTGVWRFQL